MTISLSTYSQNTWSIHGVGQLFDAQTAQLVLCFAAKELLSLTGLFDTVRLRFPHAEIVLCSAAGEIYHDTVQDNTLVAIAMTFKHTRIQTASVCIPEFATSTEASQQLVDQLAANDLVYMMVLADGSQINGSDLVDGFKQAAKNVLVTGGLAANAVSLDAAPVGLNQQPSEGTMVAIGFYGEKLVVTHGSQCGWDAFGLEKKITRSEGNELYEIDGKNVLTIYEKYLGPNAESLPGGTLLFPLLVTIPGLEKPVVRTILSIDEEKKSMIFTGDVPIGAKVRFMKANFDKLTAAAATAALQSRIAQPTRKPDWAFLVSCVGRKLTYGPRIDEELEAVSDALGSSVPLVGFYANGEISPFNEGGHCQLHNQSMTITSFYELL